MFVVLGVLQLVVAFFLAVFFLSVRALTSSLQHVETVPSYAAVVLVSRLMSGRAALGGNLKTKMHSTKRNVFVSLI